MSSMSGDEKRGRCAAKKPEIDDKKRHVIRIQRKHRGRACELIGAAVC